MSKRVIATSLKLQSLSTRLVVITALYSLLIAMIVSGVQIYIGYQQSINLAKARFAQIETGYLPSLEAGVWEVSDARVAALLDSIAQLPDVGKIVLTNDVQQQFSRNEQSTDFFARKTIPLRHTENGSTFALGTLDVELTPVAILAKLKERAIGTAMITLLTLLIGSLCVLLLFQRLVSRHLHTMAEFAKDFDVKNLNTRLQLQRPTRAGQDELDVVANAINAMQATLKTELELRAQVEQELRAHKDNLEFTVEERTQELKATVKQLDEASAAKSSFLANMSHEIRTPMNAVLGMLQLAQQTELNPRQKDYVTKAHTAAKSLLGLLNDILDFSKIDAGKLQLDNHPFELDALMRDLGVILSGNQAGKNVEVMFDIDPHLPPAFSSDRLRLQQILINLAGNALKFTAQGHVLISVSALSLSAEQACLRVAVSDTGIGITPEQQARIFDGFVQAEASTTRRFGGTGLGLVISKRLVNLLGGELHLESELGRGSRFWFDLNLTIVPPSVVSEARALGVMPGLRILVVDDNAMSREVLVRTLNAVGAQVDAVDSGQAAVHRVADNQQEARHYDVVLMDLCMPGIDGLSAAEQIAKLPSRTLPAVIMVTAFGREEIAEQQFSGKPPYVDFLTKPVTPQQIMTAILSAVSEPAEVAVSTAAVPLLQPLAGLNLLVVEDNELNRQIALELLESVGAQVKLANGGIEGVAMVLSGKEPFDLVIMDVQMPDIDGMEATRRIRADQRFAQLPILAMTANASQADREECLAAGMTDHIGKPIDIELVTARILTLLQRSAHPRPLPHANPAAPPAPIAVPEVDAHTEVEPLALVVKRFSGRVDFYERMLADFPKGVNGYIETLRHSEQAVEAAKTLHSIKGIASTMGAKALANLASELEQRCKAEPQLDIKALLNHNCLATIESVFEQSVVLLTNALALYKSASVSSTPSNAVQLAVSDWKPIIQALLPLLEANNMQAMDVMENLYATSNSALKVRLQALREQVNSLDFGVAITTAKQLLAEHQ